MIAGSLCRNLELLLCLSLLVGLSFASDSWASRSSRQLRGTLDGLNTALDRVSGSRNRSRRPNRGRRPGSGRPGRGRDRSENRGDVLDSIRGTVAAEAEAAATGSGERTRGADNEGVTNSQQRLKRLVHGHKNRRKSGQMKTMEIMRIKSYSDVNMEDRGMNAMTLLTNQASTQLHLHPARIRSLLRSQWPQSPQLHSQSPQFLRLRRPVQPPQPRSH